MQEDRWLQLSPHNAPEVDPQQRYSHLQPDVNQYPPPEKYAEEPIYSTPAKTGYICGLNRVTFWLLVALAVLIVIGAAVGGGVGGALSSDNSSDDK